MPDHHTTIHKDGRTTSIDTDEDGDQTITTAPDDHAGPAALTTAHTGGFNVGIHSEKPFDGASFVFGLMCGVLLLYLFQLRRRRRRHRPDPQIADVSQHDVAALARRTATLERIITDPATRTANEIEALR